MSGPIGSSQWMYSSSTSFFSHTIDQSLRFNDDDSPYLSRAQVAGNQQTWTWSSWVKRGNLGTVQTIFSGGDGGSSSVELSFETTDAIRMLDTNATYLFLTTALFRDVGAWYHIVVENDTTQSTVNDRTKLYVNGEQITSFSTDRRDQFTEDYATGLNANGNTHYISRWVNGGQFFDGYMAEINFIDGTALDPTSFGETKDGVWVPKSYSGSYGNNGFHLDFSSSSFTDNVSDPDVFADQSGEGHNWNAYAIKASDVVPDSPTNNFATFNSLVPASNTYSEGNLKNASGGNNWYIQVPTMFPAGISGKWYAEFYVHTCDASGTRVGIGVTDANVNPVDYLGNVSPTVAYYDINDIYTGGSHTADTDATFDAGDIISVALNLDDGEVTFRKNNSTMSNGTQNLVASTLYTFATSNYGSGAGVVANFGQDDTFAGNKTSGSAASADDNGIGDFYYAPPSGFLALCTSNLQDVTISPGQDTQADDHFDILLWTGNGTNAGDQQEINGLSFTPDFVWTKGRSGDGSNPASGQQYHELHDSVRGAGTRVFSNEDNSESDVQTLKSFDNDGFTVAMGTGAQSGTNQITTTMVGWSWKAGGTATSNSDGDITSSVSANTDAGFSIISYTGAGSTTTFGHGLGVQPEMLFFKNRDITKSWMVLAKPIQTTYLTLDTTADDQSGYYLSGNTFDSRMTTSLITVDGSTTETNTNGEKYICYAFASILGFSKVGSYVGNGSSDGVYVNVGFAVKFLIVKTVSSAKRWVMFDSTRSPTNPIEEKHELNPDDNAAEGTSGTDCFDFLSNGFKLRRTGNVFNTSGHTYIYLAIGEAQLKFANAR